MSYLPTYGSIGRYTQVQVCFRDAYFNDIPNTRYTCSSPYRRYTSYTRKFWTRYELYRYNCRYLPLQLQHTFQSRPNIRSSTRMVDLLSTIKVGTYYTIISSYFFEYKISIIRYQWARSRYSPIHSYLAKKKKEKKRKKVAPSIT